MLKARNPGWTVTFAGLGINLALGVLYAWSVISKGIPDSWGWTEADKSWPYSICCLVFCLAMVPAGRLQDRYGPRMVATIGGVLVGLGLILASLATTPLGYILGFGVLAGAGIGFGYASATPPAIKWFPAARTGVIAGIVVSGFGLASVYIAPLARALIDNFGVATTVLGFGVGFLVAVTALAQLLRAPPAGYQPGGATSPAPANACAEKDFTPTEMLRTWQFYVLWFLYACGAGAGLMVIAKLAKIAMVQAGLDLGFFIVAALAVGNGAGRILAGLHSDRIGRRLNLFFCFCSQAVLVVILSQVRESSWLAHPAILALIAAAVGANYGLVFTAWGVGGFSLALLAGRVYDSSQSFNFAYYCSVGLLVVAAATTLVMRRPATAKDPIRALKPV